MGWSNFIIIEDWKILIESSREVGELEDYIKESLDKIISDTTDIDISISDLKVSDITLKDLCVLASAYENVSALAYMNVDKLLIYWLECREIEYDIKSEYNLDIEEYKEKGYNIIRRWSSEDITESDTDKNDDNKESNQDNKEG